MANSWIKMAMDLHEKPEVIVLSGELNMDRFSVVGRLHRLWSWFDAQSHNGHAKSVTSVTLDEIAMCDGFSQALQNVGWLVEDASGVTIPNFDRHNGKSAKKRAEASERKRLSRKKEQASQASAPPMSQEKCDTGHTKPVTEARPEKRREEKKYISSTTTTSERVCADAPILEDVLKLAGKVPYPLTAECAEAYWLDRESVNWIGKHNNPITNWRADLQRYASHWNTNNRKHEQQPNSRTRANHQQPTSRSRANDGDAGAGISVPVL